VSAFYQIDLELEQKSEIYRPLSTTLYNTLRRINDFIVLWPNKKAGPTLLNTLDIDFEKVTSKNLKVLLNFKKVVIVADYK
jgi:hypothetical protein